MKQGNCSVCVAVGLAVFAGTVLAEVSPKPVAEFKVASGGRHLVVPVSMGGKTYSFLVDFGASHTTFDKPLEPLLGEPKNTLTVEAADGQTHKASIYYAPEARMGPIDLQHGGPVYCVDLTELREVTGLDVQGVIGMGLLRRYVVQMDFDAGRLRFFESDDQDHPQWGSPVKMASSPNGTPLLMVGVGPKYNAVLLLDTGYMGTGTLPGELFDQLVRDRAIVQVSKVLMGSNQGNIESQAGRLNHFVAGDLKYTNLIFEKSSRTGMLGLGFLSRHTVTIDSPGQRAYLKPGKAFERTDENDMSGLHLLARPGGVTVHSVDAKSPAAMAGLKKDDVLLLIDGKPVQSEALFDVRKLLRSEPGREVTVVFQRGGKKYRTAFALRRML